MKDRRFLLLVPILIIFVSILAVGGTVPQLINYQGRVTDKISGLPLDGETVDMTFAFYETQASTTALLTVLQEDVLVTKGIYNVLIGSGTVTPGVEINLAQVFQKHGEVWMGIRVDSDPEMAPRSRITSVPYSLTVDPNYMERFMHTPDWDQDGHTKDLLYGGQDCNDADPNTYPSAPDPPGDGIDSNCDGADGLNAVYMFATSITFNGNLGGRAGADTICQGSVAAYPSLPTANVRAFISVSSPDQINMMPTNYGVPTNRVVVGPTNKKIADDWNDLMDGFIDMTLESADVLNGASTWWSGSNEFGMALIHCNGWTDGTSGMNGRIGIPNTMGVSWMSGTDMPCSVSLNVLCLAWEN